MDHVVLLVLRRALVEYLEPARAYNHQYRGALREGVINGFGKVLTWPDVFNVHEDTMDAYNGAEVIGDPAGVGSRVVAPITDEDVVRGGDLFEIFKTKCGSSGFAWLANRSWRTRRHA